MRRYIVALAVVAACAGSPETNPTNQATQAQLEQKIAEINDELTHYSNGISKQQEAQSLGVELMAERIHDVLALYDPKRVAPEQRDVAIEKMGLFHSNLADYRRMVRSDASQEQLDRCYGALMMTTERIIFALDAQDIKMAGPY